MANIVVKCIRGAGDQEADIISDSLIVTQNMAVLRGKRFLDDPKQGAYNNTFRRSLTVPHKVSGENAENDISPGKWVSVSDNSLGLNNTLLKVTGYTIKINPTGVWGSMETEEYKAP